MYVFCVCFAAARRYACFYNRIDGHSDDVIDSSNAIKHSDTGHWSSLRDSIAITLTFHIPFDDVIFLRIRDVKIQSNIIWKIFKKNLKNVI